MPTERKWFDGLRYQKEVAAGVKLLPSLTQRLVIMRIWQASGLGRLKSRSPAECRSGSTFFRNYGSELTS
jgi:hypothetical protein